MAIPYMGSKRKIAPQIYSLIKSRHPDSDTIVDLFAGGGSISEYFFVHGWNVVSNDKDKYISALLKSRLKEKDFSNFISRDQFFEIMNNKSLYENFIVGFLMSVYSFGNKGTAYLYSKDRQKEKESLHNLIVKRVPSHLLTESQNKAVINLPNWPLRRRMVNKLGFRVEHLERVESIMRSRFGDIVYNLDYSEVPIPSGAIIYCDPPYRGTAEYTVGSFDYDRFYLWATRQKNIYISEYNMPAQFKEVLSIEIRASFRGGLNSMASEKVFTV